MKLTTISMELISNYETYLKEAERSKATLDKYIRDIIKFYNFLPESKPINKQVILDYKVSLEEEYKMTSINSMLVALNGFLEFLDLKAFKVKLYKLQQRMFSDQNKELTKLEYMRLLSVAKNHDNHRLYMLIQAICSTGLRVSEHKAITVESLKRGRGIINNKGKIREIYFDRKLSKMLLEYCKSKGIKSGCVFLTSHGKPLDRSNIWRMMKELCEDANVAREKVFPHNLRHLFAFQYYRLEKDLVRLAGLLGHSSIETTRIYTMSKGTDCIKIISRLGLIHLPIE